MTRTIFFSTLVFFSTVSSCAGIDASPRRSTAAEVPRNEEISLLQAQVEVKKGEANEAEALVDEDRSTKSSHKAMCTDSTCDQCSQGEKIKTVVEERPLQKANAPSVTAEGVQENPCPMLGFILEILTCLIVLDGLRRYASKEKDTEFEPDKQPVEAVSRSGGNGSLFAAALAGDESAFEAELLSGQRLSQVDSWGCTALHYAAKGGSTLIVEKLLALGANVDAIDSWDETALHLAARSGHAEVCEILLKAGASLDDMNAEDHTPLVVAGQAGSEAVCSLLIEKGAGVAGLSDEQVPVLVARLLMVQVIVGATSSSSSGDEASSDSK